MKKLLIRSAAPFLLLIFAYTNCSNHIILDDQIILVPIPNDQLYIDSETKFTGNGYITLCYTSLNGITVELKYGKVINGERIRLAYDGFSKNFNEAIISYPPAFSINLPLGYNAVKLPETTILSNTVNNESDNLGFSVVEHRFYDDEDPYDYKLMEFMRIDKNENGDIEKILSMPYLLFNIVNTFSLKGDLVYEQVTNNNASGKKETAFITVNFDIYCGEKELSYFNMIGPGFSKTIYSIITEDIDNIYSNITGNIVFPLGNDEYADLPDSYYNHCFMLVDKNSRLWK